MSKRSRPAGHLHGDPVNVLFKNSGGAFENILLMNVGNDRADDKIPITANRYRNDGLDVKV